MIDKNTNAPVTGSEIFYTPFEPKTINRFMCYIPGIPSYLIKEITRPSVTRKYGKWVWNPIRIRVYDPIVPSATQLFYKYLMQDYPAKFNMTIEVLGPVGDSVEKWEIKNAEISEVDFGNLNWSSTSSMPDGRSQIDHLDLVRYYKGTEPAEVTATIIYDFAELLY